MTSRRACRLVLALCDPTRSHLAVLYMRFRLSPPPPPLPWHRGRSATPLASALRLPSRRALRGSSSRPSLTFRCRSPCSRRVLRAGRDSTGRMRAWEYAGRMLQACPFCLYPSPSFKAQMLLRPISVQAALWGAFELCVNTSARGALISAGAAEAATRAAAAHEDAAELQVRMGAPSPNASLTPKFTRASPTLPRLLLRCSPGFIPPSQNISHELCHAKSHLHNVTSSPFRRRHSARSFQNSSKGPRRATQGPESRSSGARQECGRCIWRRTQWRTTRWG